MSDCLTAHLPTRGEANNTQCDVLEAQTQAGPHHGTPRVVYYARRSLALQIWCVTRSLKYENTPTKQNERGTERERERGGGAAGERKQFSTEDTRVNLSQ